jgi:hypothetical protein
MTGILLPSVQSLLIQTWVGNQQLATGTAFVCESKRGPSSSRTGTTRRADILIPRNQLSPTSAVPDSLRILHNRGKRLGEWVLKTEPLVANGNPRWAEHPKLGDAMDVVALPLTDLDDVELYPHDLVNGPAIAVHPADAVSVVGFSFGLQAGGSLAVWATGFVASEPARPGCVAGASAPAPRSPLSPQRVTGARGARRRTRARAAAEA